MESQDIYNTLEQDSPAVARRHVVGFFNDALLRLKSNQLPAHAIAYEIAGLLSTQFSRSLPEDDPLLEIMTIAGELEIEPENADQLTQELIEKIEALTK